MENLFKKKIEQPGTPGTPASKIEKSKKLPTLLAAGVALFGGATASAQNNNNPVKQKWISTKDMSFYKNVTENRKPIEEGVRFTDIHEGDTVVQNIFPVKGMKDGTVVFKEGYWKDPSQKQDPALEKAPIKTHISESGDTEKTYQLISKANHDTVQFTQIIPGTNTPRKNAPSYLGEINSNIPVIKESNALANRNETHSVEKKQPRIISKTISKNVPNVAYQPYSIRDISHPNMNDGETEVPAKMPEQYVSGVGPSHYEMTGNSRDFINRNTMSYYRWIKDAKNWRRMDISSWDTVQNNWKFIENKMREVEGWENGGDPHDRIDMSNDLNFLFVKKMMAQNPATIDAAMEQWKTEREARNEEHMAQIK